MTIKSCYFYEHVNIIKCDHEGPSGVLFAHFFFQRKRVDSCSVYFVVFYRNRVICTLKTCISLCFLFIHAEPALSGEEEKNAPFQEI